MHTYRQYLSTFTKSYSDNLSFHAIKNLSCYFWLIAACLTISCFSMEAKAHVRWMVDETAINSTHYSWTPVYGFIISGGLLYCLFCYFFSATEQRIVNRFPVLLSPWPKQFQWRIISVMLGLALIINCLTNVFLAPNLHSPGINSASNIFQAMVAVTLISGLTPTLGGACLLAFTLFATFTTPFLQMIDYLAEFVAIGLALIFYRRPNLALVCLRAGLGIQLIILAVHNKLLNPALGLAFLEKHPWNFMPSLGFHNFSNLEFVFAGGIAELCFGIAILMGWSTRFATLSISFFFTTTAVILGLHELVGHIPIMAVALALITLGGGTWSPVTGQITVRKTPDSVLVHKTLR